MRDRIAALAKQNNRSMNAEIVARLQASLSDKSAQPESPASRPEVRQMVIEEMENFIPLDRLIKLLEGLDVQTRETHDVDHVDHDSVTLVERRANTKAQESPSTPRRRITRKISKKPE